MKKLTAGILVSALMISSICISAFATETVNPEIKVYGNAIPSTGETSFTVKLNNFNEVKGIKLEIENESGLKFTGVSGNVVGDGNYKVTDKKITIAAITKKVNTASIIVNAKTATNVVESARITVKADLAQDGKNIYKNGTYSLIDGKVAVKTAETTELTNKSSDLMEETGYFIPYGSLGYTDSNGFHSIPKERDGSFKKDNFPTNDVLTYNNYKLPENGIMTFAQSKKDNACQFGSYALETAGTDFGTLCIAGNWKEFVKYFQDEKNMTVGEMLKAIYGAYKQKIGSHKYVNMTCDGGKYKIRVYAVGNKNQMWRSDESRQFALQITNMRNEEYVAVAYAINGNLTNFSDMVQYLNNNQEG